MESVKLRAYMGLDKAEIIVFLRFMITQAEFSPHALLKEYNII
jgi:hypothetical protein